MFKNRTFNIIAAAFMILAVTLACLGTTPQEVIDDSYATATMKSALTQAYVNVNGTATQGPGPTNTLASGQIVQTNIAATYAAETGIPTFTSTATLPALPTSTPTAYLLFGNPTATVVAPSDEQTVYNTVVSSCASGAPYVQVGPVVIPCTGKVLPAPASFTEAPAEAQNVDLNYTTTTACLTNAQLTAAHGWSDDGVKPLKNGLAVPWEGCGEWVVQAVGIGLYYQPFLDNFEYTVTQANGKVSVNYGPHKGMWVYGATIRQLETYTSADQQWVHDAVTLMAREFNYGFRQDPRYGTVPGKNLNLRGLWVQPELDATCPTSTVMATAILGGDEPSFWTEPDWDGGAWVFNSKGNGFHHLTHPGGPGWFDVWTAANGAVSVFADDAYLLEQLNFEEASFTCKP